MYFYIISLIEQTCKLRFFIKIILFTLFIYYLLRPYLPNSYPVLLLYDRFLNMSSLRERFIFPSQTENGFDKLEPTNRKKRSVVQFSRGIRAARTSVTPLK